MDTLREFHHRRRAKTLQAKREQEIALVLREIQRRLPAASLERRVLEFGAGSCFQTRAFGQFGRVTAIDLFLRPPCRSLKGEADLVVASIEQTPFEAQVFDLVVSNHVMEHLYDLPAAFRELRRIAKPEALFAFSMPTRTWLAFAQLAVFSSRTFLWLSSRGRRVETRSLLTPLGHGAYMHFSDAWRVFNPAQWEKTFQQNGFKLLDKVPLLFYTPSELLLPPSYRLACLGICSSMLYLLQAQ